MADNLRKYTTQEVLNKVYTDSSGITIGLNSQTSKETLNAVLDSSNNRLQVAMAGGTISGDVTISGDLTVTGSNTYSYTEALSGTGTAKANFDIMTLTNTVNAADMDGTETSILFNQYYYDGTTPAVADSGRISIGTETDWTSTASTQDSYMAFETALDGTVAEKMRITSAGRVGIGTTSPDSDNLLHIKNTSGDNRGILIENTVASSYAEIHFKGAKEYRIGTGGSSTSPANRFYIYDAGANAHRFDIDTSGNVGIGTTAPGDYNAVGNKLVVANTSGNSGITIASGTSGYGALYFADGTSGTAEYMGGVEYNHSANVMKIWANGSTVGLTLDANSKISLSNNDSGGTGGADSSSGNTIFGNLAGGNLDSGSVNNILIGHHTGKGLSGSTSDYTGNVLIGGNSGRDITQGDENVVVGYNAGRYIQQASSSVFLGHNAGNGVTNISDNVAIGKDALYLINAGSGRNVAIGKEAMKSSGTATNNDAQYNTAVGYQSGFSLTDGDSNSLYGYKAGVGLTTGLNNTAIGDSALLAGVSNSQNVAIGYQALTNTTSDSNVAVGEKSGLSNTSGTQNTAVGRASFYYNETGNYNTAIGYNAQLGVSGNSHSNNTSVGYKSMFGITTGTDNVGVGYDSLLSITTGSKNTAIGMRSLDSVNTGVQNTAVGRSSLPALTIGGNNIGIGFDCGLYTTEGNHNIFIGTEAGGQNRTGDELILIGYRAGYALNHDTSTDGTVAIGYESLKDLTTGSGNTALGFKSMQNADGAEAENTCIGYLSGQDMDNDASTQNTYVGIYSGAGGTGSATYNTAVGAYAFRLTGSLGGTYNTAVGKSALGGTWENNPSNYNTAIGGLTLDANMDGALYNTAVGYASLSSVTSGDNNTGIGTGSGNGLTSGSANTILGFEAGYTMTTTGNCVLLGYQAGKAINSTGANGSVAIGTSASLALTSGANQVSIGFEAGKALTTAGNSTFIGYQAGLTNTTGNNVAIGDRAFANTDANANSLACTQNVAVGNFAMGGAINNTVTGAVAIGYYALGSATCGTSASNGVYIGKRANMNNGGGQNIAIGGDALFDANGTETGNVAIGVACMDNVDNDGSDFNTVVGNYTVRGGTGIYTENVVFGYEAQSNPGNHDIQREVMIGRGAGKATYQGDCIGSIGIGYNALTGERSGGNYNIALGYQAGNLITTGDNNICIGVDTDPSANSGNDQIVIGSSISGGANNQFTFGKASNVVQNEFDTDAAWTRTSDVRKKRNIKDDKLGLEFINKLRPVTHQWKPSNEFPKEWNEYSEENNMNLEATMHGLIAQEVKQALDDVGVDTFSGWKERKDGSQTVSREMFITPLIKAVQELSAEVKQLKKQLEDK